MSSEWLIDLPFSVIFVMIEPCIISKRLGLRIDCNFCFSTAIRDNNSMKFKSCRLGVLSVVEYVGLIKLSSKVPLTFENP